MAEKGSLVLSVLDYSGEVGRSNFHAPVITAANFAAQETLRNALIAAYDNMIWGSLQKTDFGNSEVLTQSLPANNEAERESKWLVQFHDTTTLTKYRMEIPAADQSLKDPNDHAHANIGDAGAVDAFVDAFEAYARSADANPIVIDEITFVGRNL